MNILGLISQLIGIKTLRLTYIYIINGQSTKKKCIRKVTNYSVCVRCDDLKLMEHEK